MYILKERKQEVLSANVKKKERPSGLEQKQKQKKLKKKVDSALCNVSRN